jgi:hypothetical protein
MYAGLSQQWSAAQKELCFIHLFIGIIQTGARVESISLFICREGNGLVEKLFAKKVDNIRQPGRDMRAI